MTKTEKIQWLATHAPAPYARARAEAINELDEATPIFCFCGALATGLHTMSCRKYQERMRTKIVYKQKNLLPENQHQ